MQLPEIAWLDVSSGHIGLTNQANLTWTSSLWRENQLLFWAVESRRNSLQMEMTDEAVKWSAEPAASQDEKTNKENANKNAEIGSGESTKKTRKKFSVISVTSGSELSDAPEKPASYDSRAPPESPDAQPQSPSIIGCVNYGYATNEAIPMTIFYRSPHSQGHGRKQRPSLHELRKSLGNEKVRKPN